MVDSMVEAFRRRRALMVDGLSNIARFKVNQPMGAFYVFPDISQFFGTEHQGRRIDNADDMAMFLLEEARGERQWRGVWDTGVHPIELRRRGRSARRGGSTHCHGLRFVAISSDF